MSSRGKIQTLGQTLEMQWKVVTNSCGMLGLYPHNPDAPAGNIGDRGPPKAPWENYIQPAIEAPSLASKITAALVTRKPGPRAACASFLSILPRHRVVLVSVCSMDSRIGLRVSRFRSIVSGLEPTAFQAESNSSNLCAYGRLVEALE